MSSLLFASKSILIPFNQHLKFPKTLKTLSLAIAKMSSWTCSQCTYINPPSRNSSCEICLSAQPQSLIAPSSTAASSESNTKWSCGSCTFLNPYRSTICEICGTRASASLLSTFEIDDDDLDEAQLGSSGTVFLPLRPFSSSSENGNNRGFHGESTGVVPRDRGEYGGFGNTERNNVGNGGRGASDSGGRNGGSVVLQPCSNKRKDREETDAGGSYDSRVVNSADKGKAIEVQSQATGETSQCNESQHWKVLSYNVWFREDLEMHKRMEALGDLILLHSPDVICFQEVTPSIYEIFRRSSWWKGYYQCSISDESAFPGGYFCMQLSKLPVRSYRFIPFDNSIMGRELCIADVKVQPTKTIVVATSHLESPCPSPPTWDQMFSKERVFQAENAVRFLDENQNVIFCGDMNWDDKLDGPFPKPGGWVDAWTELRPGEIGWTYDTKSNIMLSGNRTLQKRLDRFVCKLKDFKICEIEMIGRDAIPGLFYTKEKKVKGLVKEMMLPVYPSDHFGLLLTICLKK